MEKFNAGKIFLTNLQHFNIANFQPLHISNNGYYSTVANHVTIDVGNFFFLMSAAILNFVPAQRRFYCFYYDTENHSIENLRISSVAKQYFDILQQIPLRLRKKAQ